MAAGLDATELGRPVYLPLGFRDVYPLSRWRAEAGARQPVDPPPGVRVRARDAARISPRIVAYDRPRSGFARGRILADLLCARAGAGARRRARATAASPATCWAATAIAPCISGRWSPRTRRSALALLEQRHGGARPSRVIARRARPASRASGMARASRAPPRRARFMRMLRGRCPGRSRMRGASSPSPAPSLR